MAAIGKVRVGTAGWAIPRQHAGDFGYGVSVLTRYATRFRTVEINSTFYRSHRKDTYRRWFDAVPDDFRFVLKVPKAVTHEKMLLGAEIAFAAFVSEIAGLGEKTGLLLLQLPPKLEFDYSRVQDFFLAMRQLWRGEVVLEPRHPSWFTPEADQLLEGAFVARVVADPPRAQAGLRPGGCLDVCYLRLHGSPRTYFSSYSDEALAAFQVVLDSSIASSKWCIFDNTASGAAAGDALRLQALLNEILPKPREPELLDGHQVQPLPPK